VKQLFQKVSGGTSAPASETTAPAPSKGGSGFTCSLSATEVETRRPIPLQCDADVDLSSVKVYFKAFNGPWSSAQMQMNGGSWRGTIPCSATGSTGQLKFYMEGLDSDQNSSASFGTRAQPKTIDVASETTADPPSFPGEEPPKRCGIDEAAPPAGASSSGGGGGACGAWGAPCGEDNCCQNGLTCTNGSCESAQCETDADCKDGGGSCVDGKCEVPGENGVPGRYKKNWVGLHVGLDLATVSADNVCAAASHANHFSCFYANNSEYQGVPYPTAQGGGVVNGGFAPSTVRVMGSYERLFGPIGAEARIGFAFNGGQQPKNGTAFLPVHAEVRGKYWILGAKAFSKPGPRPWVHLGGGIAEVDAIVPVQVADCSSTNIPGTTSPQQSQAACLAAKPLQKSGASVLTLNAQKQMGTEFITAGGGLMYAFGANHGLVLNLNFMILLGAPGFAVEPSLGYEIGL
jgi:hypothetical protein